MTKDFNFDDFITRSSVSDDAVPRGIVYARVSLPKRGKTYWGARWNPTHDVKRTLFLDAERCVLRFPEYNGMPTLPLMSWDAPRNESGKAVPLDQRGYVVNRKQVKAYSFKEALGLIRVVASKGQLAEMCDVICIDTVDILQDWSEAYHVAQANARRKEDEQVSTLGELGQAHGSAWSDARMTLLNPMGDLFDICRSNDIDCVVNIHSKTTTQVANVFQRDPALRAGVASALFGMVDVIGYCNLETTNEPDGADYGTVFNGQAYVISYTVSSEMTTGGSRLGFLANKTLPNCYQAIVAEYKKGKK